MDFSCDMHIWQLNLAHHEKLLSWSVPSEPGTMFCAILYPLMYPPTSPLITSECKQRRTSQHMKCITHFHILTRIRIQPSRSTHSRSRSAKACICYFPAINKHMILRGSILPHTHLKLSPFFIVILFLELHPCTRVFCLTTHYSPTRLNCPQLYPKWPKNQYHTWLTRKAWMQNTSH